MKSINKFKCFECAPQTKIEKVGYEWANKVIQLLGFKKALITDESRVSDFLGLWNDEYNEDLLKKVSKRTGFLIKKTDYIWQVAKKLKLRSTK